MQREISTLEQGAAAVATEQAVSTWTLDGSHSHAGFSVKHMMVSNVRGEFKTLTGTLELDREHIANSKVSIEIDAASISTADDKRDEHLKSADFFDVAKYPKITFESKSFRQKDEETIEVLGDLTMHGVTKPVTLTLEGPTPEYKDPWGGTRIGFSGTTKLNRKDYGLGFNVALETGGILVGEDIKITIETEFSKNA